MEARVTAIAQARSRSENELLEGRTIGVAIVSLWRGQSNSNLWAERTRLPCQFAIASCRAGDQNGATEVVLLNLCRAVFLSLVVVAGTGGRASWAASLLDITDSPQSYANSQVTVVGTAEAPALDYLGESAYDLRDGARAITVFSHGLAPVSGQRIAVTGIVGFRPPDSEFTFPPVLLEIGRQPVP
jgi:hypothetical protein